MKKVICFITAVFLVLMLNSCNKEKTEQGESPVVEDYVEGDIGSEFVEEETKTDVDLSKLSTTSATVFYETAVLWKENDEGKMVWKKTVLQGTELKAVVASTNSLTPVTKEANRNTDKDGEKKRNFIQIVYNDDLLYVQDVLVAFDAVPGYVIAEKDPVFVYKTADITNMTNTKFTENFLCAVHSNSDENGFKKISCLVGQRAYTGIYLKSDDVRTDSVNIALFQIEKKLKSEENEKIIAELKASYDDTENPYFDNSISETEQFKIDSPTDVIMLQDDGSLWKQNDDKEMVWKTYVAAGTVLKTSSKDIITATRVSGKEKRENIEFLAVTYNNEPLFVQADRVAAYNYGEGVVVKEALLYNLPDPVDYTGRFIEKGTIVKASEYINVNNHCNFYKIEYLNLNTWKVAQAYIKTSSVAIGKDDVTAIQLIKKFEQATDSDIKKELLENASKYAKHQQIKEDIEALKESMDIKIVEFGEHSTVICNTDGSNLNVRSEPTASSKVVGQLAENSEIIVTKRTERQFKVGDKTDYWLFVTSKDDEKISGWVFGEYVQTVTYD